MRVGQFGRVSRAVGPWRLVVLVVATASTAFKLAVAKNTYGTNDITSWYDFSRGVEKYGPVGIYGHDFYSLYNHPPLSGWLLMAVNWVMDHEKQLPFLIRVPASVADLVTGLIVFELVRRWRSPLEAAAAAALVVCGPALVIVSGFHGNTDPLFVMFALLSVYLVVLAGEPRRWAGLYAAAGGTAYVAAVSIKLVPVVLGPVILLALIRLGWARVAQFAAGAAALFLPLWMPVILTRWTEFSRDVLGYPGVESREWGLVQFSRWLELPGVVADTLVSPGRFLLLLTSALVPAAMFWRGRLGLAPAAGLALVLFLLLSPAFGMQYLVWPLAGAYLVSTWAATLYNVAIGLFTVMVYDHWNKAYPWEWDIGLATDLRPEELRLMVVSWLALAVVAAVGLLRREIGAPAGPATATGPARADGDVGSYRSPEPVPGR